MLEAHILHCGQRPVRCELGCGTSTLVAQDSAVHALRHCHERVVTCPFGCEANGLLARELEDHIERCERRPTPCRYQCSAPLLPAQQQHAHEKRCRLRPGADDVLCIFCDTMCSRSTIDTHYAQSCPRRRVRCADCDLGGIRANELQRHMERCPGLVVPCSLGCGATLPRRMMLRHTQEECSERNVSCEYDCGIRDLTAGAQQAHHESHFPNAARMGSFLKRAVM
eukprot:TRINITY_DN19331_c0_g1_i2.p1 TRINITY_DN19331_c0_g1~~TRINITY_DN19331_c0_g1_i2.p1  ORF type:complete len:225 (-),score=16.76 TRINITY_DN19331_c0_g1_i2:135-809(-)